MAGETPGGQGRVGGGVGKTGYWERGQKYPRGEVGFMAIWYGRGVWTSVELRE